MPSSIPAAALCVLVAIAPVAASCASSVTPPVYLSALAERLPAPARGALRRIDGAPRQLLAARSYLRAGDSLTERWSWSQAQIDAFARTPQHRQFLAEVARVQMKFAAQNAGYTLGAGTQVRSLDVQLERWNENASVGRVAQRLYADTIAALEAHAYPAIPTATSVDRFVEFLRTWRPPIAAPLAAPGLSLHGQLRAVDFHVEKDGRLVASTQIATVRSVWEKQGWADKLRLAVEGSRFAGPLQSPNEPWHYEYAPNGSE